MISKICLVALLICVVPDVLSINFCAKKMRCDVNTTHVCCHQKDAKNCKQDPLTFSFRRMLLKAHNRIRSQVKKGSRNILGSSYSPRRYYALQWDMELEVIAGCWAKQCIKDVAPCSRTSSQNVSQHLAVLKKLNTDSINLINLMVDKWFRQIREFSKFAPGLAYREVHHYTGKYDSDIGGFANVVNQWATHIGCYRTLTDTHTFLVCNYYPAPEKGKPLISNNTNKCPGKMNRYYKNLCGHTVWSQKMLRKGTELTGTRAHGHLIVLLIVLSLQILCCYNS